MRSRPSLIKYLVPVIAFAFILSCELKVPVAEIIAARTAVEDAKKFGAEKHAPEDIKKAEDLLLQSHDYITDNKVDEAKKAANEALTAAKAAEDKSLPAYTEEQIQKSDDAYNEANQAYAEKFSPEKFTEAGVLNSDAKLLREKGDFKQSALQAEKAFALSVAARDESLQNSSVIEAEVTSAEKKLTELKASQFSSAAENNLASAGTSIDNAKKGMENSDYKTSLKEIELAKKELDTAAELIRKQKIYASIQSLRADMDEMQGRSESADVKEDLDNALLELNGAEASLEQNNITDAEIKVENAEKLILGSNVKMKKNSAIAAIAKSEKLLVQARGKDTESRYKENLDKADTVIGQGKTAIKSEKYNDALTSAEEAETIINAVLNSMEASAADIAVKAEKDETGKTPVETVTEPEKKEEPGKIYVVQWRKKNTDCLWRISQTVYKDASFWPAIYLANKDQIKDPDLIFPGQKFIIPPKPQKRITYKEAEAQIKEKSK